MRIVGERGLTRGDRIRIEYIVHERRDSPITLGKCKAKVRYLVGRNVFERSVGPAVADVIVANVAPGQRWPHFHVLDRARVLRTHGSGHLGYVRKVLVRAAVSL